MSFRTYFYSLKDDGEIYTAKYQGDYAAKDHLLTVFGDNTRAIWRPERTIYEDPIQLEVPEVQPKRRRRARRGAAR